MAPYEVDGSHAGTIGVLGPTRMNYPQAMAAVAIVSARLGRAIAFSPKRKRGRHARCMR